MDLATTLELAALSPVALTIGCEVRQLNFELSRGDKETIFCTALDSKAISERLETIFQRNNHIEMQNIPPKQENNIISMAQNTENQPFLLHFAQFSAQPTSTYFISPSLVFHTDSTSVEISSNTFRDLEILYKM